MYIIITIQTESVYVCQKVFYFVIDLLSQVLHLKRTKLHTKKKCCDFWLPTKKWKKKKGWTLCIMHTNCMYEKNDDGWWSLFLIAIYIHACMHVCCAHVINNECKSRPLFLIWGKKRPTFMHWMDLNQVFFPVRTNDTDMCNGTAKDINVWLEINKISIRNLH